MRIAKEQVDVRMQVPGAVIRQRRDFGDATGYGKISGEFFTLSAGVDTTPLFESERGVQQAAGSRCGLEGGVHLALKGANILKAGGARHMDALCRANGLQPR